MFIEMMSKEGEICWINLKQVLVIKLGRPPEGWVWGFTYRNDTVWSDTFDTRERADQWLKDTLHACIVPKVREGS